MGNPSLNILALETSGRRGSIAALEASETEVHLVEEASLSATARTAQILAPELRDLLHRVGWKPDQVELVAVTIGPGSFTGLRIGVTTAKTYAYATGAKVVGVDTLEVLAAQAGVVRAPLWAILDAYRDELFVAKFDRAPDGRIVPVLPSHIVRRDEWLRMLASGDVVIGPVIESLQDKLPPGVAIVERDLWQPQASTVGRLAWQAYKSGRTDDLWQLAPRYFRPSAAEEKWSANHPT